MRYFPAALDRAESDQLIDRIDERFDQQGFGLWALEILESGDAAARHKVEVSPPDLAWHERGQMECMSLEAALDAWIVAPIDHIGRWLCQTKTPGGVYGVLCFGRENVRTCVVYPRFA